MTSNQYKLVLTKITSALVDDDLDTAEQMVQSLTTDELCFLSEVSANLTAAVDSEYAAREDV